MPSQSSIFLYNFLDSTTNDKLFTFKITQNNSLVSDPALISIYDDTSNTIYDQGAFSLEVTYSADRVIPTITYLQVYNDITLTDVANKKFYLRFTTESTSFFTNSQSYVDANYTPTNGNSNNLGNYNEIMTHLDSPNNIIYTLNLSEPSSGAVFINYYDGTLNYTVKLNVLVQAIETPVLNSMSRIITNVIRRNQAKSYYVNRMTKLGYTMEQIIPYSQYTSYTKIYLTFPTYELRQLFIEGNLAINNYDFYSDQGKIY